MNNLSSLRLSIITVCYNDKSGLMRTINSVKQQTYKNYEFIIIDGGSTDGSYKIIQDNLKHIDYWVSEEDQGIYNAMNKGIVVSKGEYCIFLNSGDYLSGPEVLTNVFKKHNNEDIIYGDLIREKGYKNYRINRYPDKLTLYHFIASVPSIHHQASFIKRELFAKYGLYREDLQIISDWEFFFRTIILHECKTKHVPFLITVFDSFGISSIGGKSEKDKKNEILKKHIGESRLKEYQILAQKREMGLLKLKNKLLRFPLIYSVVRFIYLPFRRFLSFVNYLRTTYKQ